MRLNRFRLAILLFLILLLIPFSIFFSREQVIKESVQVQILENLFKPLDLIFIHYAFLPNKLPKYEITTKESNLQKLYDTLPKTNNEIEFNYKRIVEDRLYIPIKFKIDDVEYKGEMTVRGINPPHYLGEKKSFRVRLNSNQNAPFSGIDFLVPEDRYFVDDMVSYNLSQKLNMFALKPGFANLKVNGKNFGVYETLPDEEDNTNIELATLSTADIYYRDESTPQVLANHPRDSSHWANLFLEGGTWQIRNNPEDNDPAPFSAIEKLASVNKKNGEEFFNELAKITDMDQLIRFIAHNYLMGDWHQGNQHNQSLIWLKEIGKFNFIPNDNSINPVEVLEGFHFNDFTEKITSNPKYYWARNQILWKLVNDEKYKSELANDIDRNYNLLKGPIYQDSLKPFRFIAFRTKINKQKKVILENFEKVKSYFTQYYIDTSTKNFSLLNQDILAATRIRANSYFQPTLKVIKINFQNPGNKELKIYYDKNENEKLDSSDSLIASGSSTSEQLEIEVNRKLESSRFLDSPVDVTRPTAISSIIITSTSKNIILKNIQFEFANSLTEENLKVENNLIDGSLFIEKPKLPEFVEVLANSQYEIRLGTHRVQTDLYFPEGELKILPGTTLQFDPGISLISRGVIKAQGTTQSPIIFTKSQNENWGGILVAGPNNNTSTFENISIEYGSGVSKYGFESTGTLSLHFTNAKVINSKFRYSQNDDAFNLKHGKVILQNNNFADTYSDAIDVDSTGGEITGNTFSNIGTGPDLGDAIDTSFSQVYIQNNKISGASDKCLSIGENSNLEIVANNLEKCGIGIAVKDGSEARIIDNVIKNSKVGLSLYMKKSIYRSGGLATLKNNKLEGNEKDTESDERSKIIEEN